MCSAHLGLQFEHDSRRNDDLAIARSLMMHCNIQMRMIGAELRRYRSIQ